MKAKLKTFDLIAEPDGLEIGRVTERFFSEIEAKHDAPWILMNEFRRQIPFEVGMSGDSWFRVEIKNARRT
jgi:hypothetical protein